MCGICGILLCSDATSDARREVAVRLPRMSGALARRGPDAQGHLITDRVGLGHRRLSILELSDAGAQPMTLRDGGLVISYNGEVYNHGELRRQLESSGDSQWRGHSDTEVVLRLYARWGLEGLKRIEGIFALAIWDPVPRRLVLMRDRLGVKPLYYGNCGLGLAFASEINAVLAAGGVNTSMDDQAFREYLWFGNTHADRTFYRGVRQLLPGHWLIAEAGAVRTEPWFRIEEWVEQPHSAGSFTDAVRLVKDAIDGAVRRQLVADVPVGLFLSGGLDSAAIASASRAAGAVPSAFTATFEFDSTVNELSNATTVAAHLKLPHAHLEVGSSGLWHVMETLAAAHGEPFADAANIPLYLMARALSGSVKVVLQGDGGDEMFAGYRRYAVLRHSHWWRLWPSALTPTARIMGELGRRFARMASSVGASDPALRMGRLLTVNTPDCPPESLLLGDRRRELESNTDPFLAYRHAATRFAGHDAVQQMLLTDLTVQLPSQFLAKVDRATMAVGIEARVPLLDEQVARLVIGMPTQWKVRGLEKKALLRAALRGRIPDQIIDGPKTGFGVPYEQWLRTNLFDGTRERLLDRSFATRLGLCTEAIESELQKHRDRPAGTGFLLWSLLQACLWDTQRPSPSV